VNIPNYKILDPVLGDPAGYITKDSMWAAVPYGKRFVIIHNGQQVHEVPNLKSAKKYIVKESKLIKIKTSNSTSLEKYLT
jgi:ABC-type uncharacterized transport system ATPase component